MDFWSTFNVYLQVLEVVFPLEKDSGQFGFRGPCYGCSKRVGVRAVSKLGIKLKPETEISQLGLCNDGKTFLSFCRHCRLVLKILLILKIFSKGSMLFK